MSEKIYRIGEAAALLDLKAYVLRFWETEFPQLVPVRTDKGQRLYSEENIALLRRIKYLLHEQGLTIEGARRILMAERKHAAQSQERAAAPPAQAALQYQLHSVDEVDYTDPVAEPSPAMTGSEDFTVPRQGDEFGSLDPFVLAEVIDGLEEVRRMLLPR